MTRLLVILCLLLSGVAKGQVLTKDALVEEFANISILISAEVLGCGHTNSERILKFNKFFDAYMIETQTENGVTQQTLEGLKMMTLIVQHELVKSKFPEQGCNGLNTTIHQFEHSMKFADSVYDYYTPLLSL